MADERIRCHWFTPTEIRRMIRTGRLVDGKTIAAFLMFSRSS